MKKLLELFLVFTLIFCCFLVPNTTQAAAPQFSLPANEFVRKIKVGWNLGNTFESCQTWGNIPNNPTPDQQETGWGNPKTTKQMIDYVKKAGFNAVRMPVTWGLQVEENNGTYTIKQDWMNRVKEVVGYCISNNMYVIVNMHHDDRSWLNISADNTDWIKIKDKYRQLWKQIATAFKDYDERLILEGGNEILATSKYDDCGKKNADYCWWGHNQRVFDRQNELYEIFVDTVRHSNGYNDVRYLVLPTYGAQWYDNQVDKLYTPDENETHLIIDIHWYSVSDQQNLSTARNFANIWVTGANKRNMGIILGECGFSEKYDSNTKVNWANTFIKLLAEEYQIPAFLWDDGGSMKILDRKNVQWTSNSTLYVKAVIKNTVILQGDVNNDGAVTLVDVYLYRMNLAHANSIVIPKKADLNFDGEYNIKDILILRKYLAGEIKELPTL